MQEGVITAQASVFPTGLGWFGLYATGESLSTLTFGHDSAQEVRNWLSRQPMPPWCESDWNPELRQRLERYANGQEDDFADVVVATRITRSNFQQRVVNVVRLIRYGLTLSYAEVARLAGSPGGARAVGRIIAKNTVPIIIPCHRVVGAQGQLGGYSAPRGLKMKEHLLRMEAEVAGTGIAHRRLRRQTA